MSVSQHDFLSALSNLTPSVSAEELQRYERLRTELDLNQQQVRS